MCLFFVKGRVTMVQCYIGSTIQDVWLREGKKVGVMLTFPMYIYLCRKS